MSLYADYLKERTQKQILESDLGFCVYQIFGTECYIEDIYVVPNQRKYGEASRMADMVSDLARGAGCKYLTGSVCVTAAGANDSLRVLQSYGMKLLKSEQNMIYMVKDL